MRKYASKKSDIPTTAAQTAAQAVSDNPGIPMSSMRSMLMQKAMNDRSHRIDLPEAMREKMERAFGMNFGKVNLYESESVDDAGASAIAQGGNIAFAPGAADFNSLDGQRRLGHELSHIASQARGEATGSGFLDNGALEARADREGALAAAGEQVYSGSMTDAPSFAGASAPMQAAPPKDKITIDAAPQNNAPQNTGLFRKVNKVAINANGRRTGGDKGPMKIGSNNPLNVPKKYSREVREYANLRGISEDRAEYLLNEQRKVDALNKKWNKETPLDPKEQELKRSDERKKKKMYLAQKKNERIEGLQGEHQRSKLQLKRTLTADKKFRLKSNQQKVDFGHEMSDFWRDENGYVKGSIAGKFKKVEREGEQKEANKIMDEQEEFMKGLNKIRPKGLPKLRSLRQRNPSADLRYNQRTDTLKIKKGRPLKGYELRSLQREGLLPEEQDEEE